MADPSKFSPLVNYVNGVPQASDFEYRGGTPICVNALTGTLYVMLTGVAPYNQIVVANANSQSPETYYFQDTASDISTYKKMIVTPFTPKTTLSTSGLGAGTTTLKNFATDAGVPGLTFLPAGSFEFHIHAAQTAGTKNSIVHGEFWEVGATGTDIAMIGVSEDSNQLISTETEYRLFFTTVNVYTLASVASRIVCRVRAVVSGGGSAPTVALYYGDEADSHVSIPVT